MPGMNLRCFENPQIRKADDGSRKMTFVASDGTRDSAHTVLNVKGWDLKRYNSNGIVGYQHKVYGSWEATDNPDNIIGKGRAYVEGDKLMLDVEFEPEGMNELADKIWKKLEFGTLKAVSVGFRPLGKGMWGKGDEAPGEANETYYYAGQELLEVSVVNIPANPNALKRSADLVEEELAELRKQVEAPAPAPEPGADPEPQPEPAPAEDGTDKRKLEIEKAVSIARAALLV